MHNVVIIGAGFGGLWAARHLAKSREVSVTLIDRNNYHTFLPLLYQVAAAELDPSQIAYPIRGVFRKHAAVHTVLAEVTSVDWRKRIVHTDGLDYPYDYCVISPGSQTAFYGVPGAEEHSFGLKTLEDAVRLRNRLLSCFEMASLMRPEDRPRGMLRVAVVGAGPTGVEYAGALAELLRAPLARDFPELTAPRPRVVLVDGQPLPLAGFADPLREYTARRLEKMGVELHFGSAVASVDADGLVLQNGERIEASTVVWNAGVRGHDVAAAMGLPLGRGGRVTVQPSLQNPMHPEIQIIGDVALLEGQQIPLVAPNAIQQGEHAAKNIVRMIRGEAPLPFTYRDKGSMVTIGRSAAVAQIGGHSVTGFPAWVLWLSVHLAFLIGFRNRIFVLLNWAWDYFFYERAVRIILPRDPGVGCCGGGVGDGGGSGDGDGDGNGDGGGDGDEDRDGYGEREP